MKNRESAARSRARKQEYTAQLEVQVAKLRQENRLLLEKVVHSTTTVTWANDTAWAVLPAVFIHRTGVHARCME